MGADQIGDFADHVDVRRFQIPLQNGAIADGARRGVGRLARSCGLLEQIVADSFHTPFIGEDGQGQLALVGRRHHPIFGFQDLTGRVDGDPGGLGVDGDAGHHRIAVLGDDLAGVGQLKGTIAGIGVVAVGQQNLEIALALNRQIQSVVGVLQRPLSGQAINR